MNIRKAVYEDIDNGLLNLFIDGFNLHHDNRLDIFPDLDEDGKKHEFEKMFNDSEKNIIVVEDNNIIVGFIEFVIRDKKTKSLWIDELFVNSDYRRKGYGKALMDYVDQFAKENNCQRVEFNCWKFNDNAIKFYNKLGYLEQRIIYEKNIESEKI
jgi:GNAT superfamily N-acetyltransferase